MAGTWWRACEGGSGPLGRRIVRVLMLVLLGLGLVGCKAELLSKVDEVDANLALTVLYSDGITASKTAVENGLWKVEVDQDDFQRALAVTTNQGVPRERFSTMGDLFKKEGLVSTPTEVRMRHLYALSQELSSTLSHIDGVISARVHPVMPVNDPLSTRVQAPSAAVFIKHAAGADLQQLAPAIKTLVARSIEGLNEANVSLTFVATRGVLLPPRAKGLWAMVAGSDVVMLLVAGLAVVMGALGWLLWRQSKTGDARGAPSQLDHSAGVAAIPRLNAPAVTLRQRMRKVLRRPTTVPVRQ